MTIRTNNPHGLIPGEIVTIAGVGVAGYNGTFMVLSVPSTTQFTYVATAAGLAPSGGGTVAIHIVTVTTTAFNNLVAGETVTISGVDVAGYNGNFTVLSVPTTTTFTYTVATSGLAASGDGTVSTLGNFVDQNQDAITGETSSNTTLGDIFAVPNPSTNGPFVLPYDSTTLPLIIPGPYILTTDVVGQPISPDNVVLQHHQQLDRRHVRSGHGSDVAEQHQHSADGRPDRHDPVLHEQHPRPRFRTAADR